MLEAIIIALIAAVPPTILAFKGWRIGVANGKQGEGIHQLVNSNLTKVKADLEIALDRVGKLEKLIIEMKAKPDA